MESEETMAYRASQGDLGAQRAARSLEVLEGMAELWAGAYWLSHRDKNSRDAAAIWKALARVRANAPSKAPWLVILDGIEGALRKEIERPLWENTTSAAETVEQVGALRRLLQTQAGRDA